MGSRHPGNKQNMRSCLKGGGCSEIAMELTVRRAMPNLGVATSNTEDCSGGGG